MLHYCPLMPLTKKCKMATITTRVLSEQLLRGRSASPRGALPALTTCVPSQGMSNHHGLPHAAQPRQVVCVTESDDEDDDANDTNDADDAEANKESRTLMQCQPGEEVQQNDIIHTVIS